MPQTVFELESSRDVLIVIPRGDAVGFRDVDVETSADSVQQQISALSPPLVVADLGSSNYFGSVIIGALASFAEQVEQAGGAFAACHVSDDMQGVLKVMRLDDCWRIWNTRKEAVRAVRAAVS